MTNFKDPGLHMVVGIPGSGKSTFAKQLSTEFGYWLIELDAIREHSISVQTAEWRKKHEVSPGFAPSIEGYVWQTAYDALEHELRNGSPVVWDCTNVKPNDRHTVKTYADKFKAPITVYLMETPWEECLVRNAKRDRVVPLEVMLRMKEWWDRNCSEDHLRREGFDNIIRVTATENLSEQLGI